MKKQYEKEIKILENPRNLVSKTLENGEKVEVPSSGFVRYVDHMGNDAAIVQAARVSYGSGTKSTRGDRDLLRYLMRHQHCYHPSMQVLTIDGWKLWSECLQEETFVVPDPSTRTLRLEKLPVEAFDCNEYLAVFQSERMSYKVTQDHRMWFKGKYRDSFEVVRAFEMPKWGHFDPMTGYTLSQNDTPSTLGKLLGFTLGDGSWSNGGGITFHLKKNRKKIYLKTILNELECSYTENPSHTYADAVVIYIPKNEVIRLALHEYLPVDSRAADKQLHTFIPEHASGIFDGLVNSDGHINKSRNNRVEFSSSSPHLISLFQIVSAICGYDAHITKPTRDNITVATAFPMGRTSLEARKQYFATEHYEGKVYCATTSTGMLLVRGSEREFAFVCGNTTPFEMCCVKFHVKVPLFISKQGMRHRTLSFNEYSARYSLMDHEVYIPCLDKMQSQSALNKQGRGDDISDLNKEGVEWFMKTAAEFSFNVYRVLNGEDDEELLEHTFEPYHENCPLLTPDYKENPISREISRAILPTGTFTQFYVTGNLLNLMKFVNLRSDSHAQYEIQVMSNAIKEILTDLFPVAMEAFEDYIVQSIKLSRMEQILLSEILEMHDMDIKKFILDLKEEQFMQKLGMTSREIAEFIDKLGV